MSHCIVLAASERGDTACKGYCTLEIWLKSVRYRYVFFDLTRCVLLTLANVYPPNNDNPNVFLVFFDHLHKIIIGDFNLVLDISEKKKKNGTSKML